MTPRRHGWSALPMKCPHCGTRVRQHAVVLHGGVLICERKTCKRMLYVLLASHSQMAYIAEIHPNEVTELAARGATPLEVFTYLGATIMGEVA